MRFAPALLLILALPAGAQTTWYVDAAATGPGSGTQAAPYPSIQQAIDSAATAAGDTLLVAPGVYVESLNLNGKSLRIEGQPGLRPVLRRTAAGRHLRLDSGESSGTEFVRLDFSSSSSSTTPVEAEGGAVYLDNVEVTFEDCEFHSIQACTRGGAVFALQSDVTFNGCTFLACQALIGGAVHANGGECRLADCDFDQNVGTDCTGSLPGIGAAVSIEGPNAFVATDCTFRGNLGGGRGGALRLATITPARLERCVFEENVPAPAAAAEDVEGGAMSAAFNAVIRDCEFRGNIGGDGGAVWGGQYFDCLFEANIGRRGGASYEATLVGCTLLENSAQSLGGLEAGAGAADLCSLERCIVYGNRSTESAGGCVRSTLDRCTAIANFGDAFHAGLLDCTVANSIVWGNLSPLPPERTRQVQALTSQFSMVGGLANSVPGPPLMHGRHFGDVRLLPGSPAIDAGDPSLPADPDGTAVDLGALPFQATDRGGPARFCEPKRTSEGCRPITTLVGVPSRTGPDALLLVSGVPQGAVGLLLGSSEASVLDFFGGTLCVGGTIRRNSVGASVPGTGCGDQLFLPVDMALLPVAAGELLFLQVWFRDPAQLDGTSTGLSDAIVVTVDP